LLNYKNYFGFEKEPFRQDIGTSELYPLPGLAALCDRFLYAVHLSAVAVIKGKNHHDYYHQKTRKYST